MVIPLPIENSDEPFFFLLRFASHLLDYQDKDKTPRRSHLSNSKYYYDFQLKDFMTRIKKYSTIRKL